MYINLFVYKFINFRYMNVTLNVFESRRTWRNESYSWLIFEYTSYCYCTISHRFGTTPLVFAMDFKTSIRTDEGSIDVIRGLFWFCDLCVLSVMFILWLNFWSTWMDYLFGSCVAEICPLWCLTSPFSFRFSPFWTQCPTHRTSEGVSLCEWWMHQTVISGFNDRSKGMKSVAIAEMFSPVSCPMLRTVCLVKKK